MHSEQNVPDPDRIRAAYEKVSTLLLDRRNADGHWTGRLSDSPLSTATAVSALAVFRNTLKKQPQKQPQIISAFSAEDLQKIGTLIVNGVAWLVKCQNEDGGWGDTDQSLSNITTTLLVKSALILSDVYLGTDTQAGSAAQQKFRLSAGHWHDSGLIGWSMDILRRADLYLRQSGGIEAVKHRYGTDQTFSAPILTNAALAGLVPWKEVPQLPFERAAFPMAWFRFLNLHVVSYAIPALVAVGQVRFHHSPQRRWSISHVVRRLVQNRTLRLIERMQPESGGYLEAAPLTAFVVMSLAAMGKLNHPVVVKGIRFLLATVREESRWSIDTNLAAWLTSLSLRALTPRE